MKKRKNKRKIGRKKVPMLGSNHNKLWDTKCKTHGWSERALLLFKVMHFLEKATHMITYFEKGFLII